MPKGERDTRALQPDRKDRMFGIHIPPLPAPDIPIPIPELEHMPTPADYAFTAVKSALQEQADNTAERLGASRLAVVEAPDNVDADFGVAVHRLAAVAKQPPTRIAEALAENFNAHDVKPRHVLQAKTEGPFLNFDLDMNSLGTEIVNQVEAMGDKYGEQNIGNGKKVVIDCSSPNIAKYMSVGHLRSTVIGEALTRIYRAGGYEVIRDNHLGDWGTQFGMLGRAHELWAGEIPELQGGTDSVRGLYKLYVKMHEEIEREKEGNPDKESSLEREGREWFKRLEEGDPDARAMWQWSLDQSLTEFDRVYDMLGSKFEYKLGESQYVGMNADVIRALQERGVAERDPKGAVVVNLDEEKLNRLVIQKSDGTSLYATRDLATLAARTAWFDPDKILYVVGGDQKDYFKQVFSTFRRLAGDEAPDIEHVSFGMISLPEGKMSTRKGRVVFLEEVLQQAIAKAREKMSQSGHELPPEEIDRIAQQVGVGAVMYFDLGHGRDRNIKFDLDDALSFEGNTGPYLQYTHARAKAILRRGEEAGIQANPEAPVEVNSQIEEDLVKELGKFPESISRAIQGNNPTEVATQTFTTAELFNKFYNQSHILSDDDTAQRDARLRLTAASAQVIHNGLNLLGIQAPERM